MQDAAVAKLLKLAEGMGFRVVGDAQVRVTQGSGANKKSWALGDIGFAKYMTALYYDEEGAQRLPPKGSVEAALKILEGRAWKARFQTVVRLSPQLTELKPVVVALARAMGELSGPPISFKGPLTTVAKKEFPGVLVPLTEDAIGRAFGGLVDALRTEGVELRRWRREGGTRRGWTLKDLRDDASEVSWDTSGDTSEDASKDARGGPHGGTKPGDDQAARLARITARLHQSLEKGGES
ncbi:hypothetical protein [Planctomyces sp. SH-PL62]|uniref:hypothetical protein n=1 Tax=Planctomyces sp. SH-PL62 TaxID=1636152 RepID=UPI0012E7C9C2|nr:hypothetical protein [Planctomyces sp. SH-PL62]